MASTLTEEELLCSICLGVFVQPVSTPCGHNFCMSCLTSYWDNCPVCVCPVCKETFSHRPDLKVNTFISGLSQAFMSLQLCEEQAQTRVLCEMCAAPQRDAVKSCVECLSSYCEAHLEPHHRVSGLRRHTLVEPVSSLEDRVCSQHQKLLHLFCTNEGVLLCPACEGSHSNHRTLPLQQAHRELRAELGGTEARVTSMIQERVQRVCSIRQSVTQRQDQTRQVITHSEHVLNELVSKVQKSHKDLVQKMEEKQQEADSEAEAVIEQIEQELSDLMETQTKLKELEKTQDPLLFLQNHPNSSLFQQSRASSSLRLKDDVGLKEMRETLNSCTSQLQVFLKKVNKEISLFSDDSGSALRRVQRYAVDFRLDPETANPQLLLSQDLKQVKFITTFGKGSPKINVNSIKTDWMKTKLKEKPNPKRFQVSLAVVADRGFSSRPFYFEVFVGQKDEWVLGVVSESIPRCEAILQQPGCGLWALDFRVDQFNAFSCPDVPVYRGKVERVGVFVDYDRGLVSFYDVKTATCIYSFKHCVFTEKLYPLFNPCDDEFPSNLGPMILVPVDH